MALLTDVTVIYYDIVDDRIYNSAGEELTGNDGDRMEQVFGNLKTYEIHYIDGVSGTDPDAWDAWTGLVDIAIASEFAVDANFLHAYAGVLKVALSGAETTVSVTVTVDQENLNTTGNLILENAAGDTETVAYTARVATTDGYDFTISATLDYEYAIDDAVRVPDALYIKSTDSSVSDSAKNTGVFTVELNSLTRKMIQTLDYEDVQEIDCKMQHKIITDIGGTDYVIRTFQYEYVIKNLLDYDCGAEVPTGNPDGIASQAWVLALVREAMEIQFSIDGSTSWHDTQTSTDRYFRMRLEEDGEWGAAIALPYLYFEPLAADPESPSEGQAWLNTTDGTNGVFRVYDGTNVRNLNTTVKP